MCHFKLFLGKIIAFEIGREGESSVHEMGISNSIDITHRIGPPTDFNLLFEGCSVGFGCGCLRAARYQEVICNSMSISIF